MHTFHKRSSRHFTSLHFSSVPIFTFFHIQTLCHHASNPLHFTSVHSPFFTFFQFQTFCHHTSNPLHFTSLQFTPHFLLSSTFRRFVITLQIHFTSLPIFYFLPHLDALSSRFKSTSLHFTSVHSPFFTFFHIQTFSYHASNPLHFTPHFLLSSTFRRFVITLQIHFTSLHFLMRGRAEMYKI